MVTSILRSLPARFRPRLTLHGRPLVTALIAALGIALVFWAQGDFGQRHATRQALVLMILGAACVAGAAVAVRYQPVSVPEEERPVARQGRVWHAWRVLALLLAAVFTVLAYWLNDRNLFNGPGVAAWFVAILLFFLVWWEPGAATAVSLRGRAQALFKLRGGRLLRLLVPVAVLVSVTGLAVFFRIYRFGALPGDAGGIEADIADNVRDILHGRFYIYMPRNIGEGGQLYFTAALVKLFGVPLDYNAIKATTAVAGILAVGATYFLLKEAFSDRLVAVVGALFMSIAHWPVTASRTALTMASAPLWAAVTLLFLIRALKYNRTNDFLLCGLTAGLGLYFYQGFRAMPFLIAACLGVKALQALFARRWRDVFALVGRGLLLGVTLVIVFAPMARTWHDNPSNYMAAVRSRATGTGIEQNYNVLGRFGRNVQNVFYMFNWRGDIQNLNNIPGAIALDRGMAAFLLVGAALAIAAWLRWRRDLFPYLLLAFLAFLLPSALALAFPGENPSFGRTAGAIPLAYGFVALPVAFVLSLLWRSFSRRLGLAVVSLALIGLMVPLAVSNYRWYFHDYSASYQAVAAPISKIAGAIQNARERNSSIRSVYVIGYPGWIDWRGVRLELGEPDWIRGTYPLPATPLANALYVLSPDDTGSRERLLESYPRGRLMWDYGPRGDVDAFLLFIPVPSP